MQPSEYFFDVTWVGFNSILGVYRTGTLHLTSGVCALVTKTELEYWGIDELLLEPCCALKYYPEIELCFKEVEGEEVSRLKQERRKMEEDFGDTRIGRLRKFLWDLTEYPETSKAAQVGEGCSVKNMGCNKATRDVYVKSGQGHCRQLDQDSCGVQCTYTKLYM